MKMMTILRAGVLSFVACVLLGRAQASDVTTLALEGSKLSSSDVASLEKKVASHPDDVPSRTKLLGYYFLAQSKDRDLGAVRARHILWLIENGPEEEICGTPFSNLDPSRDGDAYVAGKALWLAHVEKTPTNTVILSHAANYFLQHDRELAEQYYKTLIELEPANSEWKDRLAHLYELGTIGAKSVSAGRAVASQALQQKEEAYALLKTGEKKFYALGDLAEYSFKAGDSEKAARYANELLSLCNEYKGNWNYGNALYKANTTLGLIALEQKDIAGAKKYLIASASHQGSPQLNSFGPEMNLAKGVLASGEKETVLTYLRMCRRFWVSGQKWLDQWISEIKTGGTTAFEKKYE